MGRLAAVLMAALAAVYALSFAPAAPALDRGVQVAYAIEDGRSVPTDRVIAALADIDRLDEGGCLLGLPRLRAILLASLVASDGGGVRSEDGASAIARSLICRPNDGYLLALLAELRLAQGDVTGASEALARSRTVAPREGRLLPRRQVLAWTIFDLLDPASQAATLEEFTKLVEGRYFPTALLILQDEGARRADLFEDALERVTLLSRQLLARVLYPRSTAVNIPGVARTASQR